MSQTERVNKNIIDLLTEKIKERPASPLFLSLASELKKQDKLDEAIETLLEGIRLNPDYIPARLALAQLYKENHMTSEYIKELEKIVSKSPDNLSARKMAAQYFSNKGLIKEALNHYQEILRLVPNDKEAIDYIETHKDKRQEEPKLIDKIQSAENIVDNTSNDRKTIPEITIKDYDFNDEMLQVDKLSKEQRYKEALMICDTILSRMPSNRKALQKKEELRFLLKIINKPKETALKKLRKFKISLIKLYFRARIEL